MTREDVTRRTPAIKGAKAPRSERKETPQGWSHWNWSREWRCPGAGLPTQSTGRAAAMVLLDGEARHTVVELRPVDADEGEYGGAYSLYRAMAFGPDGVRKLPDVTCVP